MVIEVLGKPPEYLKETLKRLIDEISKKRS
jgi:hypothetical protein